MVSRHTAHVTDGVPWVGVNFWSSAGGPHMWPTFDEDLVAWELATMASIGVNLTRSFAYWPDFHPEPYRIDEEMLRRFRRFVDLHTEAGLLTIPTFIVGHMSGQNWDPSWRNGRDLYTDGWMLARQAWYVRRVTEAVADHPAVAGWLISNEMPIYGGPADHEAVRSWAEILVQAVRAGGGRGPVSLGDGAWGSEVRGRDNGFRLRDLLGVVDFVGPHVYPMSDDPVRQHLAAAWECEMASTFGSPVILEEFGLTTNFCSDDHAADYYRQVLYSTLAAGATGWIAWNNTDFDGVQDLEPYRHHPHELHFGVTTGQGEVKGPGRELARFRQDLAQLEQQPWRRADTDVVLVVPGWVEGTRPMGDEDRQVEQVQLLRQAYVTARQAGLAPALAREDDGIPDAKLILVPCGQRLDNPGWRLLEDRARAGATVYVSYFGGSTPGQRGPWHPDFDRMFGVRQTLRYGLVDPVEDQAVELRLSVPVGDLAAGATLRFPVAGSYSGRSRIPIEPVEATVLGETAAGAALTVRSVGRGRIVLLAYPVEYFAAVRPNANPEDTWRLYQALAVEAGALPAVGSGDPRVIVDVIERDDGATFAVVVSQHDQPATASVGDRTLELEPYGTALLRLT